MSVRREFDPALWMSLSSVVSGHKRVSPCMRMQSHDSSALPTPSDPKTSDGKGGESDMIQYKWLVFYTVIIWGGYHLQDNSLTEQRENRAGQECNGKGSHVSSKYPIHGASGTR